MRRKGWLLVSLLWLSFGASATTVDLTPVADSSVAFSDSGNLNNNSGNSVNIFVGSGGLREQRTYIRFDLSSLSGQISAAELKLSIAGNNGLAKTNLFGLNDGDTGENWGETTITWANAPGAGEADQGGYRTLDSNKVMLLKSRNDVASFQTDDVMSFQGQNIVDFLNNDTNNMVTFILTDGENAYYAYNSFDGIAFWSKEKGGGYPAPTLTLTTVPLPPAAVLFVSALAGLTFVGRRKGRARVGGPA